MRLLLSLVLLCTGTTIAAGQAPRKAVPPKLTPEERVLSLLHVLKNHPQEDQRADAAEALAGFDALQHFEIVSALTTSLASDSSPVVRRAAARALGDLKPRTHEALDALELAVEKDDSWRVRQSARMAKWGYRVEEPKAPAAKEPATKEPAAPKQKAAKVKPSKKETPLEPPTPEGTPLPFPVPARPSAQDIFKLPPPPKANTTAPPQNQGPILVAPGGKG